jgi:hypothetical protein
VYCASEEFRTPSVFRLPFSVIGRVSNALLAISIAIPSHGVAQSAALDSTAVAATIAKAIQARIPHTGPNRGAAMDERPSSQFASAPWNRLVGQALRAIDSTIFVTPPTVYTTRLNVVSVTVATDSLVVRVAVTTCRDTPRGVMFGGAGYDYVLRRTGAQWILQSDRARGNGDGVCR